MFLCQKLEVVLSVHTAARQLNQLVFCSSIPGGDAFCTPVTPPVGAHAEVQIEWDRTESVCVGKRTGIKVIKDILCGNLNRKCEKGKQCGNTVFPCLDLNTVKVRVCVGGREDEKVFPGQQSDVKKRAENQH